MPAYLLMTIMIEDQEQWRKYPEAVVPLIARFGGEHAAKGGGAELLEGRDEGQRIAMFRFESMEAIKEFWNSPDYVPVKELRLHAASLQAWAVPGA